MALKDFLSSMANAIRTKKGTADTIKASDFPNEIGEVYEAGKAHGETVGKKARYDEFWDALQQNGNRTAYYYAFPFWGDECFYPKYDIRPTGWAASIFTDMTIVNFKQRLIDCGVTFDLSKGTSITGLFSGCRYNTRVPTINTTSATDLSTLFYANRALIEIEKLVLKSDGSQIFRDTFYVCVELKDLTIEGVIGQNGFDVQWSTKLSKASITSIVNALSTTTSGLTVTLSKTAVNKAFETSSGANNGSTSTEWLALVATRANWTISLA